MNMLRYLSLPMAAALMLLASSCTTSKYAYIADAPRDEEMAIVNNFGSTLMPDDQVYIYVDSKTPQSVAPFNEETNRVINNRGVGEGQKMMYEIKGYTVSSEGDIIFPILGRMHVAGKTLDQLAAYIEGRLVAGRYVRDPQVTVRLMNFRVTVIGEVAQPQQIHVVGNRLTIFEALAICGDITMDGLRDCVTVIRTTDETQTVDTVDLTSRTLLESPYYYLQQNDIVYVEPTKRKKRVAWRNEDWPTYLTTGASALRLAYLLVYRIKYSPAYRQVLYGE